MNAEMIMGLVIISIVAVIMVIIGISQFNKKENPVGFYNVIAPPKKEEISDVIQWNKKHGFIWIIYGICIELGFWLGYIMPSEVLEMVFMHVVQKILHLKPPLQIWKLRNVNG